jgi:spore coat protein A, manganese oxidase
VAAWAITSDPTTYAQAFGQRFTNRFVNVLGGAASTGGFATLADAPAIAGWVVAPVFKPDQGSTNKFTITAQQAQANILNVFGKNTTVWGYKNFETQGATFPGRTFEVQRGAAITVGWRNKLTAAAGPLPHILPVDQTTAIQSPTSGVPIATHHHGSDSAVEFDGLPDQWTTPLRVQVGPGVTAANLDPTGPGLRYQYTNAQEASLHWYHDHAESLTRLNVTAGLAGLYVVRDANEAALQAANIIPKAPYELGMVLQDRTFDALGNFTYSANPADYPDPAVAATLPANLPTAMPENFGDIILVNGKAWPNLRAEPRPYRVRLLNGSDSRFYTLSFGTTPVYQIGTDLGLLNRGVRMSSITIAPGERVDLVLDFSAMAGQTFVVGNSANGPFPFGDPPLGGATIVMQVQVNLPRNTQLPMPVASLLPSTNLRRTAATPALVPAATRLAALRAPTVRRLILGEGTDQYGRILPMLGTYHPSNAALNRGTLSFQDPPTETPPLNATEVWEIYNISADSHPLHMHLVQFQVIDRTPITYNPPTVTTMANGWQGVKLEGPVTRGAPVPAPAHEGGWKDTVVCPPDEVTRILVKFTRRGKYIYHCHILSHEDHDMMRWYQVI